MHNLFALVWTCYLAARVRSGARMLERPSARRAVGPGARRVGRGSGAAGVVDATAPRRLAALAGCGKSRVSTPGDAVTPRPYATDAGLAGITGSPTRIGGPDRRAAAARRMGLVRPPGGAESSCGGRGVACSWRPLPGSDPHNTHKHTNHAANPPFEGAMADKKSRMVIRAPRRPRRATPWCPSRPPRRHPHDRRQLRRQDVARRAVRHNTTQHNTQLEPATPVVTGTTRTRSAPST